MVQLSSSLHNFDNSRFNQVPSIFVHFLSHILFLSDLLIFSLSYWNLDLVEVVLKVCVQRVQVVILELFQFWRLV